MEYSAQYLKGREKGDISFPQRGFKRTSPFTNRDVERSAQLCTNPKNYEVLKGVAEEFGWQEYVDYESFYDLCQKLNSLKAYTQENLTALCQSKAGYDALKQLAENLGWTEGVDYRTKIDLCNKFMIYIGSFPLQQLPGDIIREIATLSGLGAVRALEETPLGEHLGTRFSQQRTQLKIEEQRQRRQTQKINKAITDAISGDNAKRLTQLLDENGIDANYIIRKNSLLRLALLNRSPLTAGVLVNRGGEVNDFVPPEEVLNLLLSNPEKNEEAILAYLDRYNYFYPDPNVSMALALRRGASLGIIYTLLEKEFDPRIESLSGVPVDILADIIQDEERSGYETGRLRYLRQIQGFFDDYIEQNPEIIISTKGRGPQRR